MTAAELRRKDRLLVEGLEEARAAALEASAVFDRLLEQYRLEPRKLDEAAQRVIFAAGDIRPLAHALAEHRASRRRGRRAA